MKVFPIYYFPPISWFAAVKPETSIQLETCEHYRKQQYFNRMRVKGPNGVMSLSVPVVKAPEKTPMHERRIAYAEDWQKNHWKSLEASYRSSPYFEYYEDRIAHFYTQKWDSLMEFNLEILKVLFQLLDMEVEISLTESFKDSDQYEVDYRPMFNARKSGAPEGFTPIEYEQVFPGYDPDLSILDLLCNEGPAAVTVLKNSFQ